MRWAAMAVFAAVMITAFVLLGRWQLHRLEWRRHNNEVVQQHESAPVVPFSEAFRTPIGDDDQWQRVEVRGRYDTAHDFQVRYRNVGERRGVEIVTPLRAEDGRTVLVDRGFSEVPSGQPIPDAIPPAPDGEVTVVGYVRRNERGNQRAVTPVDGRMRLISAPAVAEVVGYPLVDGYLSLQTSSVPQEGGLQPVGLPSLTEGPHLSYALQWFSFTLIAVVGLVVLIRGDVRERRERREETSRGQGRDPAEKPDKKEKPEKKEGRERRRPGALSARERRHVRR